ncbi:hypothetical protein [Brachybacterium sp. UNK5269]|uniref:hypothetical protein n=1 Tax=Brachybacterium sp. UNK5269 TaxID=3408576 RepID=UPI003BAF7D49
MAYRFNPPPNWPIDDAGWTPPPGWQPDPSWGPAPEGWNFWIDAETSGAADGAEQAEPAGDDATRVVSTDQQLGGDAQGEPHGRHEAVPAAAEDMPAAPAFGESAPGADDDATHVAGTDPHDAPGAEAANGSATAEYEGPDLQSDLSQQAPYESAQDQGYGAAAGASAAAAGATAAGAAPEHSQAAPGYGQAAPESGYGQPAPAPGYGQGSPAPGYGQGSPAPGYGQGSASDYPAANYSQGSPAGAGWTASTQPGEAPRKGLLQRFWWVGCIIAALLVLALVAVGGIVLLSRGGGDDTAGGGVETSQGQTTEAPTEEDPTAEPTEEPSDEPAEETPTPTDLATIDPSAQAVDIVGLDGTGTIAVHMAYVPGSELVDSWDGGPMEDGEYGDYLVLTAKLTVTEGTFESLNPFQFTIKTPYGGEVTPSSNSYSLEGSGLDFTPADGFQAGDEYTIKVLYEVQRAGGNTLNFTTYVDDYSWEVPA